MKIEGKQTNKKERRIQGKKPATRNRRKTDIK